MRKAGCAAFLSGTLLLLFACQAQAARVSDVAGTRHNLSANSANTVKAVSETQICVFCHTPHGANTSVAAPLWNRALSSATYTPYASSSMEASAGVPGAGSKLCLSCHDGTMAIGAVNVLNGQTGVTIGMQNAGAGGTMAHGSHGITSGHTRNLGTDLTNDHPIAFTFDASLALVDGELRNPDAVSHIATRASGVKPDIPLEQGKVECISCHDPHIRDSSGEDIKFLRLNRFQSNNDPGSAVFNRNNDIICLACHSKEGWLDSAHAHELVANETYTADAAALRDFPNGLPVWRAACLNCHDSHTVQGARRLLREGTDGPGTPRIGGSAAQEETCYQCHAPNGGGTITPATEVPDIKSDFLLPRRMPVTTTDQPRSFEAHDIGGAPGLGKDLIEMPLKLGKGDLFNRHAECTDCHNPHRVIKNRLATNDPAFPDAAGTHTHSVGFTHNNLVSGVLRGTWGVEPQYASPSFHVPPSGYTVKKGVQPVNGATDVNQTYVTREYQICLKCHSDYAFDEADPPNLGSFLGGTPSGTNGMIEYTNQAREFQSPAGHEGEGQARGWEAGACSTNSGLNTNNHRSWHPVMKPTGRSAATRGNMNPNNFLPPWNVAIGTQTMYCTDCHGSSTPAGTDVPTGGENGNPWGPHGSTNDFILKGNWTGGTGTGEQADGLCFKCHDYNQYANPAPAGVPNRSGFSGPPGVPCGTSGSGPMQYCNTNMHIAHAIRIGQLKCNWCHVAVPHGYTNKALLHNVNDVGPEAGLSPCTTFVYGPAWGGPAHLQARPPKNFPPYYYNAMGPVVSFAVSGSWTPGNCRGAGYMLEACANPP